MSNTPAARAATAPGSPARDNRFPPGIPFIVGNEGAERFSFYGMRQILYIFLVGMFTSFVVESSAPAEQLAAAKVHAVQIVHLFNAGVYLFPMIGAIIADRLLGKYRVIFWVSLVYCTGNAAMALAGHLGATGNMSATAAVVYGGLLLIALGSGGIKPCVSANVGDQFTAANSHLVTRIFQIFYFIINFGSFFASVLTPWLYKEFGAAVAFGVPGVLMALATLIFWLGRHRFVRVPPKPGGTLGRIDATASILMIVPLLLFIYVALEESEPVVHALTKNGWGALPSALAGVGRHYWWAAVAAVVSLLAGLRLAHHRQSLQEDHGFLAVLLYAYRHQRERQPGDDFWAPARRHFGEEAADGPPAVLRIIVVFSMVSVFWALFDQHSSTWVEQAKAMNLTLVVPALLWKWWILPGVFAAALFGAVWLFLWVSNRSVPRAATFAALGGILLWGGIVGGIQLASGGTQEIHLLPAQIAGLNPLFVMMIIPLLNALVYGPFERRGRPLKPLHRMTAGMLLAAFSFVAVALIQARIEAAGVGQVHVLWQTIPFFILTVAEVLVSVTGLEFAYTQAPRAMKSTIMGFWLLCVTFGNVLVAFLAPLQSLSLATFFWTFAGLMGGAALIFVVLASFYKGKSYLQPAA